MIKKISPYIIILGSLVLVIISFNYKSTDSIFKNFLFLKETEKDTSHLKNTKNDRCIKDRITIENGCGVNNLGRIYKRYLLSQKYDVDQFIDASHFGHTMTKIYFHKNNKNCALKLANSLGINSSQIHEETNLNYYHDLTLILGQNYKKLHSYNEVQKYNPFK